MLNHLIVMKKNKFAREEDGALLPFFAICVAIIFLIAALSFDLGRRASTQTELQSFVDNVALAAAGELDGQVGSRARARAAADELISDSFVFGTEFDGGAGTTLSGDTDYTLNFYATLPLEDQTPLTGAIPDSNVDGDVIARFVHISLFPNSEIGPSDNRVSVPWVFARILRVFTSDPLPDERVGAEAVAGFTALGCGLAPVFFCAPETTPPGTWDSSQHIGDTIHLRAGGPGWEPGNFAWLDVESMVLVDEGSPCFGITSTAELYACLVTADGLLTTCFESGSVDLLTGNKNGIAPTAFNTRFDMFDATAQNYIDKAWGAYAPPAPVVSKSYVDGTTCPGGPQTATTTTVDFPPDDCMVYSLLPGSCDQVYAGRERYGDSVWDQGRLNYVEQNYSTDDTSYNPNVDFTLDLSLVANAAFRPNITDAEKVYDEDDVEYHVDDPFRPDAWDSIGGSGAGPDYHASPGNPVVPAGSGKRWDYYQAEVALSASLPGTGELIENSGTIERLGSSLPQCSPHDPGTENRRLITAAVIDCQAQASNMNGKKEDVVVQQWVEIFLTGVFGGVTTPGSNDIYVEIVSSSKQAVQSFGAFRDMVQIYR